MRRAPTVGEILLRAGLVREEQLSEARERQARAGGSLLYNLVQGGAVAEGALVRTLARERRLPIVALKGKRVDPEVLALLPRELAEKYGCLPLFSKAEGGMRTLFLGVEDPTDQATVDDVSFRVGLRVKPVVVGPVELRRALAAFYPAATPASSGAGGAALSEAPLAQGDTAPLIDAVAMALDDTEPGGARVGGKPRDVPTRDILRAVVRLLIEKGVLTREELLEAVAAAGSAPSAGDEPEERAAVGAPDAAGRAPRLP